MDEEKRRLDKVAEKLLEKLKSLASKLGFGDIGSLDEREGLNFVYYRKNYHIMNSFLDLIEKAGVTDIYDYIFVISVVAKGDGFGVDVADSEYLGLDWRDENFSKILKKFGGGKIKIKGENNRKLAFILNECSEYLYGFYNHLEERYCKGFVSPKGNESKGDESKRVKGIIKIVSGVYNRTKRLAEFFKGTSSKIVEKNVVLKLETQ